MKLVPDGKAPYKYQLESFPTLLGRSHNLLADSPGLGKTLQAIMLINALNLRSVLIICPAAIKLNWQAKLEDWLVSKRNIQIINKKTDTIEPLSEIVIVNYDLIHHSFLFYQIKAIKFDLIVCDEAHRLKNMDAKRTAAVLAKNGIIHQAPRSLMMTGTPVLNRPSELYPILRVLAPKVIAPYNDYYKYAKRYCAAFQDGFALNDKGASHTDELNKKLREHYMIRRVWADVENQLPKRRYEMILIEQTKEAGVKLKTLEQFERLDFKHQKSEGVNIATLRRECAEEKINQTLDMIKDYVESVDKLVIFAYHHSVIERLENELKDYGCVVLNGACSQNTRQNAISDFRTQKGIKVFIGQIQASGEGIDGLQEVCHNILFLESSWVPAEIEQAIARLYRLGQTKAVLIKLLVWAKSIEEHMLRVALDKVKITREILK